MIDLLIYELERFMYLNFFELAVAILTSVNVYFFLILIITFSLNRQAGLQLFLLVTFSLYLSYLSAQLHFLEQTSEDTFILMPLININILVVSVFFFYLIPVVAKKAFTFMGVLFISLASIVYWNYYEFATWDLVFTVTLGLFIVYTFYRSLDWIGSLPEKLKLMLIFFVSLCLILLSVESGYLVGFMFSLMFAMHLEQLKIGSKLIRSFSKSFTAFVIGATVYYLLQYIFYSFVNAPFSHLVQGVIVGFWLGYFAPFLFVKWRLYEPFWPTAKH